MMEDQIKSEMMPSDIQIIVAENLSKLRDFYGITQAEMADKIKMSQPACCSTEQGARELNYTNLYHLAVELGINLNWILGLSNVRLDPTARKKHIENLKAKDRRKRNFAKNKKSVGKNGGSFTSIL